MSNLRDSLNPKYKDLTRHFRKRLRRYESLTGQARKAVDRIIDACGCGCCEEDDLFDRICDLVEMVKE